MRPVVIAPAAVFEIADAVAAYEATRPSLGRAFMDELRRIRVDVERFPEGFHEVLPTVRRALLHRFPYGVLYRVTPAAIEIVALMPTRADPARIAQRIRTSAS